LKAGNGVTKHRLTLR